MPTATFRYPRASNNKTITHYYILWQQEKDYIAAATINGLQVSAEVLQSI